jgi:hypothetical protein
VHELRIEIDLVTELAVYNPFDFFLEPGRRALPFTYEPRLLQELQPFLPDRSGDARSSRTTCRRSRAGRGARSTCW